MSEQSRHITPDGFKKLEAELDFLWKKERPKVTAMVSDAAAEGDRSENAEYIYGKKRLGEIDARIHHLGKLLDSLIVVEQRTEGDKVFFGAWVTIEDDDLQEKTYRIVGPDESDSKQGMISSESPMARALLGKKEGDIVTVTYVDADDGMGGTDVVIVHELVVDCTSPFIVAVVVTSVRPDRATRSNDWAQRREPGARALPPAGPTRAG